MNLIFTSMKRRKREIRYILIVTFIATFFMAGILMYQNILKAYILERNRENYGDWFVSFAGDGLEHGYFTEKGYMKYAPGLTDEDGEPLYMKAGYLDQSLVSFSRIRLYEGHLPEKDNEMAADLQTLQKLGCSYELGQEITLYWDVTPEDSEEQELRSGTFILTGTLKPFNSLWAGSGMFAQVYVTEEKLKEFKPAESCWFYRLDPSLNDLDYDEIAQSLSDNYGLGLTFNWFVYRNILWESDDVYRVITWLMMGVAVFAITWLLSSYVDKRLKDYYRYRTLGASRMKLNGIIFTECACATVPAAILGLGAAYGIGAACCGVIASSLSLQGFFAFDLQIFWLQLATVFGSILASIILVFFRTGDRRLSAGTRPLRERDFRRLRKKYKNSRFPEKDYFSRRRTVKRTSRIIFTLFTLGFIGFVCTTGDTCYGTLKYNLPYYRDLEDYRIDAEISSAPGSGEFGPGFNISLFNPYIGLTEEEIGELKTIYGVDDITASIRNTAYKIKWEGIQESEPLTKTGGAMIHGTTVEWTLINDVPLEIVPISDENSLKYILKVYGKSLTDEFMEDFRAGKLAVLFRPSKKTYTDLQSSGEMISVVYDDDPTLRTGDTVTVFRRNDENKKLDIPVIPVFRFSNIYDEAAASNKIKKRLGSAEALANEFFLLVSEGVSETLREMEGDGAEFKFNSVRFRLNRRASFEATDKVLARYASDRSYKYANNMENKRFILQNNLLRPLLLYGSLALMTLLVYLIVQWNYSEMRLKENLEELKLMRQLGMDEARFKKLHLKAVLKEYAVIPLSLICGLLLRFVRSYSVSAKFGDNAGFISRISGSPSTNRLLYAFESTFLQDLKGMAAILLILYLLIIVVVYFAGLRTCRKEGIL